MSPLGRFGGSSPQLPFVAGGGVDAGNVGASHGMEQESQFRYPHAPTEISTPVDQSASRVAGTTYQNTSGRKRRVFVDANGTVGNVSQIILKVDSVNPTVVQVDRLEIRSASAGSGHVVSVRSEVPDGYYYTVTLGGTDSLSTWLEIDE